MNQILLGFLILIPIQGFAEEYTQTIEKNFSLKTMGSLNIINHRGESHVQGWSLDRIKVKLVRKVEASSVEEAQAMFKSLDVGMQEKEGGLELSVETGKGLDLSSRLKERKSNRVKLDLYVRAPNHLDLHVWGIKDLISIKSWNASVSARATSGEIQLQSVNSKEKGIALTCPECKFQLKDLKGSLRCMGGKGVVFVENFEGKDIYVETSSAPIQLNKIKSAQMYVSSEGQIRGQNLRGKIEFYSGSGLVHLTEVKGFLSGRSLMGGMKISVDNLELEERAFLESDAGSIELFLPPWFSAVTELWSETGVAKVDLPFRPLKKGDPIPNGRSPGQRYRGVLGIAAGIARLGELQGDKELRIFSQKGDIKILPKS